MVRIWEHGLFRLTALEELGVHLIFRGVPSDAGGPDYQDAILALWGRLLVQGDVEFHVRSSDWYHHGHHLQSRYNRVVLHVVWHHDSGQTVRQDGQTVPVLVLEDAATVESPAGRAQPALLVHPCAERFRQLDASTLLKAVRAAAWTRFDARIERLAAEADAVGADQAAYSSLLEAMGYASNRETFRALAEAAPYAWIMTQPATRRGSILLEAAGLIPPTGWNLPSRLRPESWRLTRLRPGNHPSTRILAVADLLDRFPLRLSDAWVDLVLGARSPAQLREALMVSRDGQHLLGKGRVDEVAVSVVLPLVAALVPDRTQARDLFARYPSPPRTRWTRTMLTLLTEAGHKIAVRRAPVHQGLHALYLNHCRNGNRSSCPVCACTNGQEETSQNWRGTGC